MTASLATSYRRWTPLRAGNTRVYFRHVTSRLEPMGASRHGGLSSPFTSGAVTPPAQGSVDAPRIRPRDYDRVRTLVTVRPGHPGTDRLRTRTTTTRGRRDHVDATSGC